MSELVSRDAFAMADGRLQLQLIYEALRTIAEQNCACVHARSGGALSYTLKQDPKGLNSWIDCEVHGHQTVREVLDRVGHGTVYTTKAK